MHAIVQISVSMRKICWQACSTLARLRRSLFCTLYLLNKGQFSAFRHVETIITWDCFSDCFVSDCFFFVHFYTFPDCFVLDCFVLDCFVWDCFVQTPFRGYTKQILHGYLSEKYQFVESKRKTTRLLVSGRSPECSDCLLMFNKNVIKMGKKISKI